MKIVEDDKHILFLVVELTYTYFLQYYPNWISTGVKLGTSYKLKRSNPSRDKAHWHIMKPDDASDLFTVN